MRNMSWKHLKVIGSRKRIKRDHASTPTKIFERNCSRNSRLQSKIACTGIVLYQGENCRVEKAICQHQPHQQLVRKWRDVFLLPSVCLFWTTCRKEVLTCNGRTKFSWCQLLSGFAEKLALSEVQHMFITWAVSLVDLLFLQIISWLLSFSLKSLCFSKLPFCHFSTCNLSTSATKIKRQRSLLYSAVFHLRICLLMNPVI